MMGISSLRNFVTDSMAIDMGTANTIIAVKGRDVVLDEPTCVAVNELTDEIVAYGQEAYDMLGREGRDVNIIAPLSGGVVADFERTKKMLAHFVKKAKTGGSQVSLQAVMSMISDVTHVEQRALLNAAEDALEQLSAFECSERSRPRSALKQPSARDERAEQRADDNHGASACWGARKSEFHIAVKSRSCQKVAGMHSRGR